MLNGADGLSEIAAGLVGQGLTILESVKKDLIGADAAVASNVALKPADRDAAADGKAANENSAASA